MKVKQKNGASYDLLEETTYNSVHPPLTTKDAAAQTSTYTYNGQGQLLTITTPPRAGISENRTTTYDYDEDGYLPGKFTKNEKSKSPFVIKTFC